MNRLGFITGMKAEAETISVAARYLSAGNRPLIAVTGGAARRAETAALDFGSAGVAGLISYGIAGGLDPDLKPGDIILADGVLLPEGDVVATDAAWRAALAAAFDANRLAGGTISGSDRAVSTVAEKASLFARTGARAADMESHGVARAAREHGLPLVIVRAIADPAARAVPSAALVGLGAAGERKPFAVIGKLLRHPRQLPQLIRLARDSNAALRNLGSAAPAVLKLTENKTKDH